MVLYLDNITNLSRLMSENNISGKQLAAVIGVSPGLISDWKSGRITPSKDNLIKLSEYFNVTTDYLLGKTGAKKELPPAEAERVQAFADELLNSGTLPDLSEASIKRLLAFINASGGLFEKFRNED